MMTRRALVLGGASWNHMVYLDRFPRPEPQTVFAARSHETLGSSGAGKAVNLAHLGWNSTLWALVGRDDPGDQVRHALAERNVELLAVDDPAGTMRHVNLMDAQGDRISIFATTGTLDMSLDQVAARVARTGAAASHPDAVIKRAVAADLVAVTIFEHCRGFLAPLRDAGVPLWIDVHDYDGANPYHDDFIRAASHLQLSSVALSDWRRFAEGRLDAGAETVACTHGPAGASVLTEHGWLEVPAPSVTDVVDSNGAGDAWFAGFATGWCEERDAAKAGARAAASASAALGSPDLGPPLPQR